MSPSDTLARDSSALDLLRELQLRLPESGQGSARAVLAPLVQHLQDPLPPAEVAKFVEAALAICRGLYGSARSGEALPLARAVLRQCTQAGNRELARRAATACGGLAADTADLVAGIEYHVQALRLATADADTIGMSRVWNNIGGATAISGNYEMAARCYHRALALIAAETQPTYSRYAACGNLADSFFQSGDIGQGIRFGEMALREMTPAFRDGDLYSAILLRRNLVRLLLAANRIDDAEVHVTEAVALAQRSASPRARIAADITRATHELATGRTDIALTRLDHALGMAREVPATLRDTLACIIRAEEAAGNVERALMRLEELSHHVYSFAVERARAHVELAGLSDAHATSDLAHEQDKARLISQLAPPSQPEEWKALQRLAVSAVLRMDETGWHGMRVGALTKALAVESGSAPLAALEMGLAAELHDIGMLSVPAGILSKRGSLNASEQAIVRKHTDAGAEMLLNDRHPRMLLAHEIAKYHHARWDGGGYPGRVGGKFIPLGARICAIADAYDAMVCGLCGPTRTMGEALEELGREAGKQFDPELASCFDTLIRREVEGCGMEMTADSGMNDFQALIASLKDDRGFV